jgi:hypothetical protein
MFSYFSNNTRLASGICRNFPAQVINTEGMICGSTQYFGVPNVAELSPLKKASRREPRLHQVHMLGSSI